MSPEFLDNITKITAPKFLKHSQIVLKIHPYYSKASNEGLKCNNLQMKSYSCIVPFGHTFKRCAL